jgi:hypothetical protein
MPVTTVLNEDTATIISDEESTRRFSWSAAFAGALVATAVTLFLLTLGSGVGLSLVTVRHATATGATTFLTLGAIYFLAAQAFGFAAGGHVVGRMIGPALETDREEEFRVGTHGLVAWALAVVATASLVALSVLVAGSATATGAMNGALAATASGNSRDANQTAVTSYWVDTLFRPTDNAMHASLIERQYAQADNGTATDAGGTAPATDPGTTTPSAMSPSDTDTPAAAPTAPVATPPDTTGTGTVLDNGSATVPATTPTTATPRSIGADKAEAGRILTVGMADGATLGADDKAQLARLTANDTGLTFDAAQRRVDTTVARMHEAAVRTADTARKAAAYASLWTALALLFGAVIAVAAAISARWEADKEAGFLPGTRVTRTAV